MIARAMRFSFVFADRWATPGTGLLRFSRVSSSLFSSVLLVPVLGVSIPTKGLLSPVSYSFLSSLFLRFHCCSCVYLNFIISFSCLLAHVSILNIFILLLLFFFYFSDVIELPHISVKIKKSHRSKNLPDSLSLAFFLFRSHPGRATESQSLDAGYTSPFFYKCPELLPEIIYGSLMLAIKTRRIFPVLSLIWKQSLLFLWPCCSCRIISNFAIIDRSNDGYS